ncbi:MAG: YdbL family protein [Gammaproteobacteria bacterium]|nr:YdbL family protein [Gammaproteobacteria bacterium]
MKKIISVILLSTFVCFSALALTLQQAKQAGMVGERTDGYLGVIKGQTQAKKLVLTVNKKRLTVYRHLATKNKISLANIAKLAGKKAIAKTVKGHYIQSSQGGWVKK